MSKLKYTKEYITDGEQFHWNDETLEHFKLNSNYQTKEETIKEITTFVENECSLEDGETEEMLVQDLMKQILQN